MTLFQSLKNLVFRQICFFVKFAYVICAVVSLKKKFDLAQGYIETTALPIVGSGHGNYAFH